ncbi:hypothetical protein Hanom_Chr02g00129211 [Helianthus anomalus]
MKPLKSQSPNLSNHLLNLFSFISSIKIKSKSTIICIFCCLSSSSPRFYLPIFIIT